MAARHFTPDLFRFLDELEANNEKAWWDANKQRYLDVIRDPAFGFITAFGPKLQAISPHFVADARSQGGSLMRPYRDTRFSKDKTPYKTNVAIQFRHEQGRDVHAPGFYLNLEPGACYAGVGLWHPETALARRIRQTINDDPVGWGRAAKTEEFLDVWSTDPRPGDVLKRVPAGLDPGHPHVDDLKRRSFTAMARVTQATVTSSRLDETLASMFADARGFVRFLCESIGVPF